MKEIIQIGTNENGQDLTQIGPLALAFIGDTVFDLFIRENLVRSHRVSPKEMQLCAAHYVRAESQARIYQLIFDHLDAEEQDVARRARNAKAHTVPKHAEVIQYRMATGFEALLGHLYLAGRKERLQEILTLSLQLFNASESQDGEKEHGET